MEGVLCRHRDPSVPLHPGNTRVGVAHPHAAIPAPTVPPSTYPDLRMLFFTQGRGSILSAVSCGGAEAGGEEKNPARYRGSQHCPLPTCLCRHPGRLPPPLPLRSRHLGRLNPAPAPPCPQAAPEDDRRPLGPPTPPLCPPPRPDAPHLSARQHPAVIRVSGVRFLRHGCGSPLGRDGHGWTDGRGDGQPHKQIKQTHGRPDLTPCPPLG